MKLRIGLLLVKLAAEEFLLMDLGLYEGGFR